MTDTATDLEAHLAAAAVEDGTVPADLAAWVDDGAQPDPAPIGDGFTPASRAGMWRIEDDRQASWALAKLAAAQAELAAIDDEYQGRLHLLNGWLAARGGKPRRTLEFMTDRLTAYALRLRREDPKAKTLLLPEGKVSTRVPSSPWKVEVGNRGALVAWALANAPEGMLRPSLAPTGEWLDRFDIVERDGTAKVVDPETGEEIPGLWATPAEPSATVRVAT